MHKLEPKTVREHEAIPRRMSPYGLIRKFTPSPTVRAKVEIPLPEGRHLSRVDRRRLIRVMRKQILDS